nr:RNA-directed DNA polymerase, eukaryota [Tanacetum cinerariifolium]
MGGFWVMVHFLTKDVIDIFKSHVGVNSWFSLIRIASDSFTIDEKIAWIDIEGVPLKGWTCNTFVKIASKWGSFLYEEDEDAPHFHRKQVLGWAPDFSNTTDNFSDSDKESTDDKSNEGLSKKNSEVEEIPESIFEEVEPREIKFPTQKGTKSNDAHSADPFNLYNLLNNNQPKVTVVNQYEVEPRFPPRFTPCNSVDFKSQGTVNQVQDISKKITCHKVDSKEVLENSACSGHFKKLNSPKTGGSILQLIEDLIKVGIFDIRSCWGNLTFDFDVGPSVGNSGGILCVWDTNMFLKDSSTVSDFFIAIRGKWLPNSKNLLIISIYAPQELADKRMLWQYLLHIIEGWNGEVIIIGDCNEVCAAEERFGSIFNVNGAAPFNSFINPGGLVEVPSGGYTFTWAFKSAAKMSKLDRFLISEDLMRACPYIYLITLDRFLSDHRPILLRFNSFVSSTWNSISIQEPNGMIMFVKKLKILKGQIRLWVKDKKDKANIVKKNLKKKIADIDLHLDKGDVTPDTLGDRLASFNKLLELEKTKAIDLAQKAKIKWAIEGDENSKYFQGIINKQRNNLAIRGIMEDGHWIEEPSAVKNEFLSHFKDRFDVPCKNRLFLDMPFPNMLSSDQILDLEKPFSKEEIKGAVWDCGLNKFPGPDGFT